MRRYPAVTAEGRRGLRWLSYNTQRPGGNSTDGGGKTLTSWKPGSREEQKGDRDFWGAPGAHCESILVCKLMGD